MILTNIGIQDTDIYRAQLSMYDVALLSPNLCQIPWLIWRTHTSSFYLKNQFLPVNKAWFGSSRAIFVLNVSALASSSQWHSLFWELGDNDNNKNLFYAAHAHISNDFYLSAFKMLACHIRLVHCWSSMLLWSYRAIVHVWRCFAIIVIMMKSIPQTHA